MTNLVNLRAYQGSAVQTVERITGSIPALRFLLVLAVAGERPVKIYNIFLSKNKYIFYLIYNWCNIHFMLVANHYNIVLGFFSFTLYPAYNKVGRTSTRLVMTLRFTFSTQFCEISWEYRHSMAAIKTAK